jgi:hypothetical protein
VRSPGSIIGDRIRIGNIFFHVSLFSLSHSIANCNERVYSSAFDWSLCRSGLNSMNTGFRLLAFIVFEPVSKLNQILARSFWKWLSLLHLYSCASSDTSRIMFLQLQFAFIIIIHIRIRVTADPIYWKSDFSMEFSLMFFQL